MTESSDEDGDDDLSFFETSGPDEYGSGDWLANPESDEYEGNLAPTRGHQPWLHGMADLPSPEEWAALSSAPEPDVFVNPPQWRTSAPFTAGAVHGADPLCGADSPEESAERWKASVPGISHMVLDWIRNPEGFQVTPTDETPVDEPSRPVHGEARTQLNTAMQKMLRTKAVRVWNEAEEGPPVFICAIGCVPKKNTLDLRTIHDWRIPNRERGIKDWRAKFEGLRHLPAVASKGCWAFAIDMKSGYHAMFCGPAKYMCFRASVRPSWLSPEDRVAAGLPAERDVAESDDFIDVMLTWRALSMGNKLAAMVYSKLMRSLARRWRCAPFGFHCLSYLDDWLFCGRDRAELTATMRQVVEDCHYLGVPISFEKSILPEGGVQRLVWLGYLLDFETGRIHVERSKVEELLELLRDIGTTIGSWVGVRRLAKITGKLMAMSRALQPVRLMSKECYALIRCKCKEDWERQVELSAGCVEELVFWASNLVKWNAHGRAMFAEASPCTLRMEGDAGPSGWGARGRRSVCTVDGKYYQESFSAWSPTQKQADQTMKELLALEESLHAFGNQGVDFSDRAVRARIESSEARSALDLQPGAAAVLLRGDVVSYATDNTGVEAYINAGGAKTQKVNAVVRRIWLWLLERGARLEVHWMPGVHMVASGTDGLSRQRWQRSSDWMVKPKVLHSLRHWASQWSAAQTPVFARDVASGAAYMLDPSEFTICFPGGSLIADWVGFLRQQRRRGMVLVPRWHGPATAAVTAGRIDSRVLGPAYGVFDAFGGGIVKDWLMEAVVVDFRGRGGVGQTVPANGSAEAAPH